MTGRDLTGVIFVAIFLPLIIVIAALCLWCNCHLQRGGKSRRPTPSHTAEMQLPYLNSPPFDSAYFPPNFRKPFGGRPRRHTSYRYDTGPPQYTPRINAANALPTSFVGQPRRQELLNEMYDGFDITPGMVRPQSPDSAYAGLDLTSEMLGWQREREMLAQTGGLRDANDS